MSGPRVSPFRRGHSVGAAVVPPAAALDRAGARVDVLDVHSTELWLVVLLATGFPPCRRLLDGLSEHGWQDATPLVVVLDAEADHHPELTGRVTVMRETARAEVAAALDCNVYPTAFALIGTTIAVDAMVPHELDDLLSLARALR